MCSSHVCVCFLMYQLYNHLFIVTAVAAFQNEADASLVLTPRDVCSEKEIKRYV